MATQEITLQLPSKYAPPPSASPSPAAFTPPPLDWLHRTWTVTHSTLAMWRTAQNVRITYSPLPPSGVRPRIDDLVEYEKASGKGGVKTIAGTDTADAAGGWDWRGKGLLGLVTSHWELLGWGERDVDGDVQRWAVTWFAATLFTKEGVDLYSDHKGGMSTELAADIIAALKALPAKGLVEMVEGTMQEVKVALPWKET